MNNTILREKNINWTMEIEKTFLAVKLKRIKVKYFDIFKK